MNEWMNEYMINTTKLLDFPKARAACSFSSWVLMSIGKNTLPDEN